MVADDVMFCCCVKLTDVLPFYCIAFSLGGKHPKTLRQTQHQVHHETVQQVRLHLFLIQMPVYDVKLKESKRNAWVRISLTVGHC